MAPVPLLLCAAVFVLGGCLITDPAQIGEPVNSPPSIRSPSYAESRFVALNQIIRVDYDPNGQLELPVVVRDENISDSLVIQVWIDFVPGVSPGQYAGLPLYQEDPSLELELPELPPTGSPDRDEHLILIDHSVLGESDRCHRVEVFVTRSFAPTSVPHRQPETPGDMGTATFWVAMNANGGVIDMDACP